MENLLDETSRESMRVIDLKMGTNTLTRKHSSNADKVAYRAGKDKETTSAELGFCICGLHVPGETFFKIHR